MTSLTFKAVVTFDLNSFTKTSLFCAEAWKFKGIHHTFQICSFNIYKSDFCKVSFNWNAGGVLNCVCQCLALGSLRKCAIYKVAWWNNCKLHPSAAWGCIAWGRLLLMWRIYCIPGCIQYLHFCRLHTNSWTISHRAKLYVTVGKNLFYKKRTTRKRNVPSAQFVYVIFFFTAPENWPRTHFQ